MREILFRCKKMDCDEWVEGFYVEAIEYNKKYGFIVENDTKIYPKINLRYKSLECDIIDVDSSTVGQYTGKTDKNKVKIFEDDIIRANHDGAVGVIRFGEAVGVYPGNACHVGFYVDWQGEDKDYLRADLGYWASRSDVEVVGNIHDNPELLKSRS